MQQYRTMDHRGKEGYPEIKSEQKLWSQNNAVAQSIVSNDDSSRQSLRHYKAQIEREISVKYTHNPEKPRGIYIGNTRQILKQPKNSNNKIAHAQKKNKAINEFLMLHKRDIHQQNQFNQQNQQGTGSNSVTRTNIIINNSDYKATTLSNGFKMY